MILLSKTNGPQKHRNKIDTFDIKRILPGVVHSNCYLWNNTYSYYEVFTFVRRVGIEFSYELYQFSCPLIQ